MASNANAVAGSVCEAQPVTVEKLSASRAYVVVGCFVIGMLLTPPDIVSQTLLAVPMWLLFEIGLLFGRAVQRRQADQDDSATDGD